MPQVSSVAKITDAFVTTVKFLTDSAGARMDIILGKQPRSTVELPADHTDPSTVREAFPFASIDEQMDTVAGDDNKVGSIGDIQVLAIQSDLQALCIRASVSRHTSRSQRKLNTAFRLHGHAAKDGMWQQHYTDRVQAILARMQG